MAVILAGLLKLWRAPVEEFEFKTSDGTRYSFSFERTSASNKALHIRKWHKSTIHRYGATTYTRIVYEGNILWTDVPGLIADPIPLDVRQYMERVSKLLAFT